MMMALTLALALVAGANEPTAAPEGLRVELEKVGKFAAQGHPVRVRLTFANDGDRPLAVPAASLSGAGLWLTLVDESHVDIAPPNPTAGTVQVAPHSELSVVLDLATLEPKISERRGLITIGYNAGPLKAPSMSWEIWRDYAPLHAVIETNYGELEAEFFFDKAPITVKNFLDLAADGFYSGLRFHRVWKGFMIQGGCPNGDGTGNAGHMIPLEAGVKHTRGVLSMARGPDPDSASSQFFVVHQDSPFLDGNYAAFGQLVRGIEVVDKIAEVPTDEAPNSQDSVPTRPKERIIIERVRVIDPREQKSGDE